MPERIHPYVVAFTEGRLGREDVRGFWDCTGRVVSDYQRVTSAPGGVYSARAVRRFLDRYFLNTDPISDALLQSLMELKRVLLSGDTDTITTSELNRLQALIDELKELSLEIHPHASRSFFRA
ncbi:MAG: hypothetical protein HC902_08840 [Calothrix sp. SM1_5_4]|nr:hypothetical protein [Calothrix sp. SM1_5_4]